MTVGSLFAGIGGFDLAASRVWGWDCVRWQVEIDPFSQRVLAKHWPAVPRFGDIRELTGAEVEPVDLICGGFPCQDVSNAGTTHEGGLQGLDGERSGLWREFARVVWRLQPRWLVIENSAALTVRGLGSVLHDLAGCGFDAEWAVVSAGALGAPHLRRRAFIVGRRAIRWAGELPECECCGEPFCPECGDHFYECAHEGPSSWPDFLQDPDRPGLEGDERRILAQPRDWRQHADLARSAWRETEPGVYRVANGLPGQVDRLRALGNAVVPQVAEFIFRRIAAADQT